MTITSTTFQRDRAAPGTALVPVLVSSPVSGWRGWSAMCVSSSVAGMPLSVTATVLSRHCVYVKSYCWWRERSVCWTGAEAVDRDDRGARPGGGDDVADRPGNRHRPGDAVQVLLRRRGDPGRLARPARHPPP